MRRLTLFSCCMLAVRADFEAPLYTVDLDQDAYARWKPVGDDLLRRHGYNNSWGRLHTFLESALPHKLWVEMEPLWALVRASYPQIYREEVAAFHRWMNEKSKGAWTLGQVTMTQLFYEVEDACTSIVAQHTDGTIRHARNLDYGLPGLENFTATITFTSAGVPVSRGTMYIGYCGLLTGQKLHSNGSAAWSVSLNQRFIGKEPVPYVPTIKALLSGVQNLGFTLRDALRQQADYIAAIGHLGTTPLPAPAYLAVAGTQHGEGAIITRDRNGTSDAAGTGRGLWKLDAASGGWYRLETNYDNWLPFSDGRRKAAHNSMDALGQSGADSKGLLGVLSTAPVLADDTTYTSTMSNAAGEYTTLVREHPAATDAVRTARKLARVSQELHRVLEWYRKSPFRSA
jgi:hypothetical protein